MFLLHTPLSSPQPHVLLPLPVPSIPLLLLQFDPPLPPPPPKNPVLLRDRPSSEAEILVGRGSPVVEPRRGGLSCTGHVLSWFRRGSGGEWGARLNELLLLLRPGPGGGGRQAGTRRQGPRAKDGAAPDQVRRLDLANPSPPLALALASLGVAPCSVTAVVAGVVLLFIVVLRFYSCLLTACEPWLWWVEA
ncbi:hypothetical protein VPH35_008609 [Triticum aestivum]